MKITRKNIIRYIALLLFLAIGVTQSNAVFKERDFGKTIDVLCAELEQKYKEKFDLPEMFMMALGRPTRKTSPGIPSFSVTSCGRRDRTSSERFLRISRRK